MRHMLVWFPTEDDYIINVTSSKGQAKEDLDHYSLEFNMCIL